jgi:D-alanyl-D-alanine carboxypeptidase/D-alanyl-D-alanine-endopeptidase (penicillin-binding protein 4)
LSPPIDGERAFVTQSRPLRTNYKIDYRIITNPAGTGGRFSSTAEPGSMVLTLWGNMPLGDPGANEALAVEDPASFAGQLFRSMLEKRGVIINGHTTAHHTELASLSTLSVTALASAHDGGGDAPPNSRFKAPLVLASYDSKPLSEDLRVINKVSQNLHAEMLLRLLDMKRAMREPLRAG